MITQGKAAEDAVVLQKVQQGDIVENREKTAGAEIWREMFRIVDLMREQNSEVRDKFFYRLTFNQLRMIHRVYVFKRENNGQGISLKQLAERLGITPAAASEMVDTLVKKGVLIRSVDLRDRRAISIDVADELKNRFLRSEELYDQFASDFLSTLGREEKEIFLETLRHLREFTQSKFSAEQGVQK